MSSLAKTSATATPVAQLTKLASLEKEVDNLTIYAIQASSGENLSNNAVERLQTAFERVKKELESLQTANLQLGKEFQPLTKLFPKHPHPPAFTDALHERRIHNLVRMKFEVLEARLQSLDQRINSDVQTAARMQDLMQRYRKTSQPSSSELDLLSKELSELYIPASSQQLLHIFDLRTRLKEDTDQTKKEEEKKEASTVKQKETTAPQKKMGSELLENFNELQEGIAAIFAASLSEDETKQSVRALIAGFNPESERNKIYEQIWVRAKKPDGDLNYGSNHVVDDLPLLQTIIAERVTSILN